MPLLLAIGRPVPALEPLLIVVEAKVTAVVDEAMLMPMPPGFVMLVAPVTVVVPPPTACRKPTPVPPVVGGALGSRADCGCWRGGPCAKGA